MALGQVKGVARDIYSAKKQAAEIGFWSNFSDEEVTRGIIADQSLMTDLQLLE